MSHEWDCRCSRCEADVLRDTLDDDTAERDDAERGDELLYGAREVER